MQLMDKEHFSTVSSIPTHTGVSDFFDKMTQAFNQFDLKTLVSLWAFPSLVLAEHDAHVMVTKQEVEIYLKEEKTFYQAQGIRKIRPVIKWVEWANDTMVVVDVRWIYISKDGDEQGSELNKYILKYDEFGELKIYMEMIMGELF